VIYHAALRADWEAAEVAGRYEVSTRGATLADVGFIHAAYEHQVEGVLTRYYADIDEIVLLMIDPDAVGAAVVAEPANGERFPHIYGALPVAAVTVAALVQRRPGCPWRWPQQSRPDR
jgi:glutathione S-transferase